MTPTEWHELMIVCSALSFTICFIGGLIYYHIENERKRKLKYKALKQSRAENKELKELLKTIKDIYS